MSDPLIRTDYWDNVRPWVSMLPAQPLKSGPGQGGATALGYRLTLDSIRLIQDIIRRLGGPNSDYISQVQEASYEAKALILAAQANATAALAFYTTPADPLSYTNVTETTATVSVATFTRSTSGTPYVAGTVSGLTRGLAYIIYCSDPGNAGGTVTWLATASPGGVLTNNHRIVGAIYLPSPPVKTNTL